LSASDSGNGNEAVPGVLLFCCAVVAMILANSPVADGYFHLLHANVAGLSVHDWINDGLMAIFFFAVGLEIKQELITGALNDVKKATLPVAAAFGGMLAPALVYVAFNFGQATVGGWAIPVATDIAFAVGVLSLVGKRVPPALKIFLLALAVVDDLGAIAVIAAFYTEKIVWSGLLVAALAVGVVIVLQRLRVLSYYVYIAVGIILWIGVLNSGIHATLAGVILGFLTPLKIASAKAPKENQKPAQNPLTEILSALHPWNNFLILPAFALANAGVSFSAGGFSQLLNPVTLGIAGGLLLGKPIGVLSAAFVTTRLKWASLPSGVRLRHLVGVSVLAGIGFTMSIFITNLSFAQADSLEAVSAKIAILFASMIAALLGYLILARIKD
jgi:Na+:H+ antiporter, NhaA family